jgi:hypothetical protein
VITAATGAGAKFAPIIADEQVKFPAQGHGLAQIF